MSRVFGSPHEVWWIMVKTLLLYVTAVAGFRIGERRTLAEMSAYSVYYPSSRVRRSGNRDGRSDERS